MTWRGSPWPAFALFLSLILGAQAYLGRYAHPMADDLFYALRDASGGAWHAAAQEYAHWNGRYASNFLMLFGPMRMGFDAIRLYRIVPALLLLLTVFGAFCFLRALLGPGLSRPQAAIGALIWTALYTHLMPDMPEGIFWYTGAVTYQLPNALCLFAVALFIRGIRDNTLWVMIAIGAILFVIIGCNEVIMLLVVVASTLVGTWSLRRNMKWSAAGVALAALIIGCVLMVVLAPGNEVRGSLFPHRHRLVHSFGMSLLQTARFSLVWMACPALLLLSAIFWMNQRHLAQRFPIIGSGFRLPPWKSVTALFAVVFLCMFPAYWSTGTLGQHRTANVACFFFLPLWFANLSVFATRFGGTVLRLHEMERRRVTAALLLLVTLDLTFTGNSGNAFADLSTGRAHRADEQLWKRYDLLRTAAKEPGGVATIPLIVDPPKSLYVIDLGDPAFLVNTDYAAWFGLKEVRIAPADHSEEAKATN